MVPLLHLVLKRDRLGSFTMGEKFFEQCLHFMFSWRFVFFTDIGFSRWKKETWYQICCLEFGLSNKWMDMINFIDLTYLFAGVGYVYACVSCKT